LDSKSEKEVLDAIHSIQQEDASLTIVTIAHRIETIRASDNLIYLESNSS